MRSMLAILLVAALVAGVSCDASPYSAEVDLLDIDALVDGVYSKANADWFMKKANGPHGFDCDSKCRGFGEDTDCKGLHKTTCSGVQAGKKATVHTKMVFTCLGGYSFSKNLTDDYLTMSTGCHGLFAAHTFTGITKNVTALPENCHGHCSKHHKGSHCDEHCPDHAHHSNFDAIVKTEGTCGLTHSWSLDHPLSEGATVSTEALCSGVSSFSMLFVGKEEIPVDEDMEAEFEEEAASYDSADSSTIMETLSSLAMVDTKNAEFLDTTSLDTSLFFGGENETITVTCNGEPAKATEECEGEFEVVMEGEQGDGVEFKEDDICTGKHMYFHGTYVCEGTSTSDRTATCDKGEKVTKGVCDGKQLFSMFAKEMNGHPVFGFGLVCVGDNSYDESTTPTSEAKPAPESESGTMEEPEAAPATETTRKPIHVSLFKNIRKAIV